ncbi:hypothetical protein ACWGIU_15575 [Streptomyces sp. NPDC054840]
MSIQCRRRLDGVILPLRYDASWSNHAYARLEGRLLTTLRSMPRMVGGTLRLAWDTDRLALLGVAAAEAGQGVTAAVGLLVISDVLRTLLGAGSAADRLYAGLPALAAVLEAVLASRSTAAAGRLEPKVERAAYEQCLSASVAVEPEAIEDGESRRLQAAHSGDHTAPAWPPSVGPVRLYVRDAGRAVRPRSAAPATFDPPPVRRTAER